MVQFEVGKTYYARSLCDYDCIESFTILARTAKQVTVNVQGKVVRRGLNIWEGVEHFYPHGKYSMAMSVYANSDKPLKRNTLT